MDAPAHAALVGAVERARGEREREAVSQHPAVVQQLEAPEGVRFLSRGRAFTDDENRQLSDDVPVTGSGYEQGRRPAGPRGAVVAEAADACTLPAGRAAQVPG